MEMKLYQVLKDFVLSTQLYATKELAEHEGDTVIELTVDVSDSQVARGILDQLVTDGQHFGNDVLTELQDAVVYVEDDTGALRRWYAPPPVSMTPKPVKDMGFLLFLQMLTKMAPSEDGQLAVEQMRNVHKVATERLSTLLEG